MNTIQLTLLTSLIGFILVLLLEPYWMKFMKQKGKTGIDIHKTSKPVVPEIGGFIPVIIFIVIILVNALFTNDPNLQLQLLILAFSTSIALLVGIYDDLKTLNALAKPALLIIPAFPLIIFQTYSPHPLFPFIGQTRLTLVYLFLLPFVVTVPANAMNMIDVLNGSMSGTAIIISLSVLIGGLIIFPYPSKEANILLFTLIPLIAVLLGFYYYNKYPAKVFSGDTGSLSVGAILGLIAVLGRVELLMVIALIPQIMNSFAILSSIKGLKERRAIKTRPVTILDNQTLLATKDKQAPFTLTRLLVAANPKPENIIVKQFFILNLVSGLLTILTAWLIRITIT